MARCAKFREGRISATRRRKRWRLVRREHPELDPLFDDDDEIELVPCVCGEKQ